MQIYALKYFGGCVEPHVFSYLISFSCFSTGVVLLNCSLEDVLMQLYLVFGCSARTLVNLKLLCSATFC